DAGLDRFVILRITNQNVLDAQTARREEFIELVAGFVLFGGALPGIEEIFRVESAHAGFEECLRLKHNPVLFVKFAGPELVNDFVWVNDAIENRHVQIDEETVRGLNMRGVFVANEFFYRFVSSAFGVKGDGANALGKNQELFATG